MTISAGSKTYFLSKSKPCGFVCHLGILNGLLQPNECVASLHIAADYVTAPSRNPASQVVSCSPSGQIALA